MSVKFTSPLLSFCILLLSFHGAARAQNPPANDEETVRVETNLVTVPVSVSDKNGRLLSGLKREDFRLSENGVEQEIAFFNDEQSPFTVALMLDISQSTKDDFADIQKSAAAFLEQLRPQDKIVLVAFNKYVYRLSEPTNDKDFLKKQISEMRQGGGTSVYDALASVVERLASIRGRKAIVLFSDGVDTTSRATLEESLRQSSELDALIYTIRYETLDAVNRDLISKVPVNEPVRLVTLRGENLKTAYARGGVYLKTLADNSGGRYFLADSPANLAKTFASVAAELRNQYSIGYYPKDESNGKEKRRIKVSVGSAAGNAVVRARKFYFYKSAPAKKNKSGFLR